MIDYEKLGLFYLGKQYDVATGRRLEQPVLYQSRDLLTHAVCVGMTGSGKTGLGITIIEEAGIDRIPVLAIDPKGDLANLLLTFPQLTPADFAPWIEPSQRPTDAAEGASARDAAAAAAARTWSEGLAEWQQDGARMARLRENVDVEVFTPGSRAGTPLALLASFGGDAEESPEDAAARIASTASSLLALAGVADDEAHGREHTLLSAILARADASRGADLAWLIGQIQRPTFDRIGVLDLETFFPAKDRQALALRFNSVLAAPGFDVWLEGAPLDLRRMLFAADGRPRVAIVSIAHLGDRERMLVVSMLLNAALAWTRRQSGTASLRALIYMDEVFGYLPPVANPPSKQPLLTLLKQARAFGVGVMLATQNPVDLDYKALSNMGTWFLGKLQTERDKARVLDGLESVAGGPDRQTLDATLSSLRGRVFLMHNVHDKAPTVFETRWALSYLRGPMGREELRRALAMWASTAATPPAPASPRKMEPPPLPAERGGAAPNLPRPVLPAGIDEYFLPSPDAVPASFVPYLYGAARVHYADAKRRVDVESTIAVMTPLADGPVAVDWNASEPTTLSPDALLPSPPGGSDPASTPSYAPLPRAALEPRSYAAWSRDFEQWIARARPLRLFSAPDLQLASRPDESERDFRVRAQQAMRERRDAAVEKLRASYAPKIARLDAQMLKAQESLGREQQQVEQQKLQTAVSLGATMLGALMGRRAFNASTIGRATTAARGVSRSMKEAQDVARAQQKIAQLRQDQESLQAQVNAEIAALGMTDAAAIPLETIEIAPKRGAVDVRLVTLVWKPVAAR